MRAALPLIRSLASRNAPIRSYHAGGHHRPATMNDLPVPKGDWQEMNAKKQAKRNQILAGSVLIFVATLSYMKQSKIVNFNFGPPSTYK